MKARIFSKKNCPYCVKAKELLNNKNIEYEEAEVGVDVTKEDIQQMVNKIGFDIKIKTVPQIFFITDGTIEYIGGFTDLNKYFTRV